MTKLYLEVNGPERSWFYGSIYVCVCVCVGVCTMDTLYEKSVFTTANSLFTNVCKVQHCTGYLLIQVEIVSIYKSHYMHWLVSQSSLLTSLSLECVVIFQLSPVWVQVQVQVQVQVLLLVHLLQFLQYLCFLPFFLKNTELDTEEVFWCVM